MWHGFSFNRFIFQINYRDDPLVLKNIFFFKNSLNAIIRAYLISAENLTKLIGQQVIDSTYFRMLKSKMMRMLASNDLEFGEWLDKTIFRFRRWLNDTENSRKILLYVTHRRKVSRNIFQILHRSFIIQEGRGETLKCCVINKIYFRKEWEWTLKLMYVYWWHRKWQFAWSCHTNIILLLYPFVVGCSEI